MAVGMILGIGVGIPRGTIVGTALGIGAVGMILGIGAHLGASAGAGVDSMPVIGAVSTQGIGMVVAIGGIIIIMHRRAIITHPVCGLQVRADGAQLTVLRVLVTQWPTVRARRGEVVVRVQLRRLGVAIPVRRHLRCGHRPARVYVADGRQLPIEAV